MLLLLLLTAVWLYAGHRHLQYCWYVQRRARDRLPEYRAMRDGRPKGPVPSLSIITYSIPSLAGIVWILFLFVALVEDDWFPVIRIAHDRARPHAWPGVAYLQLSGQHAGCRPGTYLFVACHDPGMTWEVIASVVRAAHGGRGI